MSSERRLHPASFLFAIGGQLRQFLLPGLAVIFTAGATGGRWEPWLMIAVLPLAAIALLRSLSYRYTLSDDELIVRTGFLFRNERHIPYRRIQNIEAIQTLAHRLLSVVEVRIETGAGLEDDARMQVVQPDAYEELRQRVLEMRAAAALATDDAAVEARPDATVVLRLPLKELLLSGLIANRSAVVIAAGFGVVWELGMGDALLALFFDDPVTSRGLVRRAAAAWFGGAMPGLWTVVLAALTIATLFAGVTVVSMIWAAVRLGGFVLSRTGDDLRTEYGLVTRVSKIIPLRRIQTLTVFEGPLYRLFGRASVKVETAGSAVTSEGGASAREPLAPIVRRADLDRLLAQVLPEVRSEGAEWHRAAPGAFGRELRQGAVRSLPVSALAYVLLGPWSLLVLLGLLLLSAVHAWCFARTLGWSTVEGAILFKRGWIWRRLTIARFSKMQTVALHRSPFDRRTRMARLRVDTAGSGSQSDRIDIPYLPAPTAVELHSRLAAEASNTRFQW